MTSSRTCPTGTFSYTIRSGDTLFNLAMRFNTTVEAIMRVNPGIDPNNLQIGQRICIPGSVTPPPTCPAGTFSYTIRSGDTLFNLAMRFNTTVEAIMRVNPGIDPNNLQIGQVICIPGSVTPPPTCPPGTFSYTIRSGDTLFNLAMRFNTTVEAIMRVNPGIDPNNLQIGQVICIPGSGTPPPPTCPMGTFSYTIRSGDTIYMLAIRYNTTVEAILEVNPGINPNNLQIGQVICIPRSGPPPISCPGGTVYVVRENDNLGTILLRFNISVMDLMYGNPDVDLDRLMPGQQLCIMPHMDRGCPCPTGSEKYTITKEDAPHNEAVVVVLARKFNTTVTSLMLMNANLSPADFKVGKMVCVPK